MAVREAESADLPERARPCRNLFSAKVAIRRKKSNFVRNKIPYRHETAIPAAPRRCALHLPHGTCPAVAGPSGFLRGRLPHQPPDDALLRNAAGAAGRLPARIYQRRNGQRQYVGRRRDRAFDRSDAGRRSLPPDGAPAADRNRGRFVRRRIQRRAGPVQAAARRNIRQELSAYGRNRLHEGRGRAALSVPRYDAGRGPHVDRRSWSEALHRLAFLSWNQQIASSSFRRRRVAYRNQIASRTDRNRRLPRRRFARASGLRQMGREVRRVLHAGRDARPDPLCGGAQHRDHPRNRPAGAQPQHRVGASRNTLQLSARHGFDQRLRLPFGVVRGPRRELRTADRHPRRVVRAVSLGVHTRRRRRGGHDPVEPLPRLSGADEPAGHDRSAPIGRPLHGAHGGDSRGQRQASRRVERSRDHGRPLARMSRIRLAERQGVSRRNGERLQDRGDAGRILLFRHAADAAGGGARLGGGLRR